MPLVCVSVLAADVAQRRQCAPGTSMIPLEQLQGYSGKDGDQEFRRRPKEKPTLLFGIGGGNNDRFLG